MKRTLTFPFIDGFDPKRARRHVVSVLVWAAILTDLTLTVWCAADGAHDVADLTAGIVLIATLQALFVSSCWGLWELKRYLTKLIIEKLGL